MPFGFSKNRRGNGRHLASLLRSPMAAVRRTTIRRKFVNGVYPLEVLNTCLCGGGEFDHIADSDRYGIPVGLNLCKSCGLCFQSPRPTEKALFQFYKEDYRKLYRNSNRIDQKYLERSLRRGRRIFQFLNKAGAKPKNGVVAEIGCGPGGILKVFQNEGNEVLGCELDEACVAFNKEQGVPCVFGSVDALVETGVKTDLIILSHLFEHVSKPLDFIGTLRGILKEEGKVYVEVPGLRNPSTDFLAGIQVAHLYYYDLATLMFVMGKAGFALIEGNETIQSLFGRSSEEVPVNLGGNFQRNKAVVQSWMRT
jgi:SAM-dependent methyltransferase